MPNCACVISLTFASAFVHRLRRACSSPASTSSPRSMLTRAAFAGGERLEVADRLRAHEHAERELLVRDRHVRMPRRR